MSEPRTTIGVTSKEASGDGSFSTLSTIVARGLFSQPRCHVCALVVRVSLHHVRDSSETLLMRKVNNFPVRSSGKGLPFMSVLKRLGDPMWSLSDLGAPVDGPCPVSEGKEVPGSGPSDCN